MTEDRSMQHRSKRDRVTVIVGLGATGLSCARFLAARDEPFSVTDSRVEPPQQDALLREFPRVPLVTGMLDERLIESADRVLVSPGVPATEPAIRRALARGAEVIGDIELFARTASAPVVAITGSNGKSTVTTLVADMATASGRATRVGGNLGTPALELIGEVEPDLYVLELSSFQLETTSSLNTAASTVLNVSPDHLDRHADLQAYAAAKRRIYAGDGAMVINVDDPEVVAMADPERRTIRFGLGVPEQQDFGLREHQGGRWLARGHTLLMPVEELRISGRHNIANALAALALGAAVGLPMETMLDTLCRFEGLPHRCQWVARAHGIDWYNDSKGTNVGATVAAITGLGADRPLVLIAGGEGKGQDFAPLAAAADGRLRAAVLIGRDAAQIETALEAVCSISRAEDMRAAVRAAAAMARPGDAVLLSPACASLDMFRNYVHRGEAFVAAVHEELQL